MPESTAPPISKTVAAALATPEGVSEFRSRGTKHAILGGLLTGTWMGALSGVPWGGLVRNFLVHDVTWSINSVCHLWGGQPFAVPDQSRNNLLFGVLALGEGWHNNHHAFPTSAGHGLRWWQVDPSYYFIRTLALLGLAWKVRLPVTASPSPAERLGLPGGAATHTNPVDRDAMFSPGKCDFHAEMKHA